MPASRSQQELLRSGEGQERQRDSFQADVAVGYVVPLVEGVGATAGTAAADRHGFASEGERDVGVGGGALQARLDAELSVDGAEDLEDARVRRKVGGGTVADG